MKVFTGLFVLVLSPVLFTIFLTASVVFYQSKDTNKFLLFGLLSINNMIMKHHIVSLNKKNTVLQILVIILSIASIIGTSTQAYLAISNSKLELPIVEQQKTEIIEPTTGNIPDEKSEKSDSPPNLPKK